MVSERGRTIYCIYIFVVISPEELCRLMLA